jgi:hypothetical protein
MLVYSEGLKIMNLEEGSGGCNYGIVAIFCYVKKHIFAALFGM